MSGVGGYVRRSERKYAGIAEPSSGPGWLRHAVLPSGAVMTWRAEPPAFQMMPLLKFEKFEVDDDSESR